MTPHRRGGDGCAHSHGAEAQRHVRVLAQAAPAHDGCQVDAFDKSLDHILTTSRIGNAASATFTFNQPSAFLLKMIDIGVVTTVLHVEIALESVCAHKACVMIWLTLHLMSFGHIRTPSTSSSSPASRRVICALRTTARRDRFDTSKQERRCCAHNA